MKIKIEFFRDEPALEGRTDLQQLLAELQEAADAGFLTGHWRVTPEVLDKDVPEGT